MSGPTSRIKQLFHAVADAANPAAALREQTDATPEEAARVLRLLGHATAPTRFSTPLAQAAEALQAPELQAGDRLGPWRLGEALGEGGMGLVFHAERDDGHFRQQAAIKLLRGWSGQEGLARLARERQILASLNHPHIARLLDGGSTPAGRPYLVMEFVDGEPIDAVADAQGLDLDARLQLFDAVGDAVAHAHAQLVIHCDIKPGNVLVDRGGQVKLLDFGIAQLAGQGDDASFSPAATPGFAPPEQLAGERPTPAWDVFALGRLLERLCSQQAGRRAAELRAVIARACDPDPAQRYAGVPALREELQRLRRHEPLSALKGQALYPLRKWLRRRWPWALTGLLVLAGSAGFTRQLVVERDRAQRAEQQAREQLRTTQAVNDFVVGLFRGADPRITGNTEVSAKSVVDQGRARIGESLREQPAQQAELLGVLGEVYGNMGHEEPAIAVLRQAIQIEGPQQLDRPLREARLQEKLARWLGSNGNADDALPHARRALELLQAQPDADPLALADAHATLGVQLGKLIRTDEARPHLQRALELVQQLYGTVHPRVAGAHTELNEVERFAQRPAQGEWHGRQAMAIAQQLPDGGGAESIFWRNVLVGALMDQGKTAEAIPLQRSVVADAARRFGPSASFTSEAHRRLAAVLRKDGQWAAAVASIRDAMTAAERGGITHTLIHGNTEQMLGRTLAQVGDPDEAEKHLRRGLGLRQTHLAADSLLISRSRTSLGSLMLWRGEPQRALQELMLALPAVRTQSPEKADRAETELHLAQAEARVGQRDQARQRLAALGPSRGAWVSPQPALLLQAQAWLARADSQPLQAATLAAEAAALLKPGGPDDALRQMLLMDRAEALAAAGRAAEARDQLDAVAPAVAPYPASSVVQRRLRALRAKAWALPPAG